MSFICGLILCLLLGAAQSQLGEVETVTSSPPDSAGENSLQLKNSVNETAYLLCRFNSIEVPEVVWTKDGAALPAVPKFTISEKVTDLDSSLIRNPILRFFGIKRIISSLKIVRLEIEDSGIYTCALSNSTQKNSFNLTITEPETENKTVTATHPAIFLCSDSTEEAVNAVWLKDGQPLPQKDRYKFTEKALEQGAKSSTFSSVGFHLTEYVFTFTIFSAKEEDAGLYTCRIYNSAKTRFQEERFALTVKPNDPTKLSTNTNNIPRFFCQFKTEHPVSFQWLKDGVPLPEDPKYDIKEIQDDVPPILKQIGINLFVSASKLSILGVELGDAGNYSCVDRSSRNFHSKLDFILEVEEGEKGRLELAIGGSASFFCQFRMRFLPIAEWTKDGVPLLEDSRNKVINQQREIKHEDFASKDPIVRLLPNKELNSLLTIYNIQPEDAGTYKCRLANTPLNLHQSWILIVNGTRTEPISQDPKLV